MKPRFSPLSVLAGLTIALTTTACSNEKPVARVERAVTSAEGDLGGVVRGNNLFALALYDELRKNEVGNVFFSPFSISAALSMTYAGAKGETAEQMREVLRLQVPDEAYHATFGALLADLAGPKNRGYELSIANRLFGQAGYPFRDEFLELTGSAYGAPLEPVDFASDPQKAREHINAWVGEMTRGRIPDLLSEDDVSATTRLALANAIYFEAQWANAFDPSLTQERPFFVDGDTTITVPMMHHGDSELEFPFAEHEVLKAVELTYRDDEVAMLVILPNENDGLAVVENMLSLELVDELIDKLHSRKVMAVLPKFELSYELPLKDTLVAMGMTNVFGMGDFSGIAEGLTLGGAVHEAFVQVDEQGTTAAAATVGLVPQSGPAPFIADHPFLFLIRDRLTGSILFIGRVTNPAG